MTSRHCHIGRAAPDFASLKPGYGPTIYEDARDLLNHLDEVGVRRR
jgi:hypothetical protein